MSNLDKAIASATTTEEIRAALEQDRESAEPTTRTRATKAEDEDSQSYTRTENIGGREFTFEAATELELERMVNNAYKVATSVQQTEQRVESVPVVDAGAEAVRKVELELEFRRGTISAAEYLEKSHAVDTYLANAGIPINELRANMEENRSNRVEQDWAAATEQFLHSPAGAGWVGGEQNMQLMGMKLQSMGLADTEDKVGALTQAYAEMKETGLVFENPNLEPAHVRQAAEPAKRKSSSSGMFGQSSGASAPAPAAATALTTRYDVGEGASPSEILDAYHKQMAAAGISQEAENAMFVEKYGSKR